MGLFDGLMDDQGKQQALSAGLLGMGAGLLSGSTGNYGQFGPAFGQGLAGFGRGVQNAQENQQREAQLAQMKQMRDLQAKQLQGSIAQQEQFGQFFNGAQTPAAGTAGGTMAGRIQQAMNSGNPLLIDWASKANALNKEPTQRTQFDPNSGLLIDLSTGTANPVVGPNGPVGPKKDLVWDSARGGFVDKATGAFNPAIGPDGNPVPAQNILEKPMTEAQSKDLLFGSRARDADKLINGIMADKPSWLEQTGMAAVGYEAPSFLGPLGSIIETGLNSVATKDSQKFNQAKRDFVNAVLRKESGAVISQEEFANADRQYFPQPGDGPEVIAQKAANRDLAVRGILMGTPQGQRDRLQPSGQRPSLSELLD